MGAKPCVLVLEDEPSIADNIVYALETEGVEASWCATAGEGLTRLEGGGFDLVILDIGLPDRTGFDVCREIRRTSRIPIIFLTARTGEIDRVLGLELGADDYVTKPFSPRELCARVKAVLRRTQQGDGTVKADEASPFSLNEERKEIRFQGRKLDLPRYEFRLLCVLIGHPGRVYSREQLMERAWEGPTASMERTVDAHIKSLRAKLREIDPEDDPIKTHRGLGYSLKEYR